MNQSWVSCRQYSTQTRRVRRGRRGREAASERDRCPTLSPAKNYLLLSIPSLDCLRKGSTCNTKKDQARGNTLTLTLSLPQLQLNRFYILSNMIVYLYLENPRRLLPKLDCRETKHLISHDYRLKSSCCERQCGNAEAKKEKQLVGTKLQHHLPTVPRPRRAPVRAHQANRNPSRSATPVSPPRTLYPSHTPSRVGPIERTNTTNHWLPGFGREHL